MTTFDRITQCVDLMDGEPGIRGMCGIVGMIVGYSRVNLRKVSMLEAYISTSLISAVR
jgi:uncharacterized protein (DUF433 family)